MTAWASPLVGSGGRDLGLRCQRIGDDIVLVAVAGELDLATAPQLRAYLVDTTAVHPTHLVLDLSAVTFLASHGIRLLIEAHDGSDEIHGELHLTGVTTNPRVRRVLQVTGLLTVLDIHDDTADVLRQLART